VLELRLCYFDWCALCFACVCVADALYSCVFSTPLLTLDLIVIIYVRRERLQFVKIPHNGILI
jgi:hypothetical protein